MKIKVKLRKIGNSLGVLLPKEVITGHEQGDEIEIDVITDIKKEEGVITKPKEEPKQGFSTAWCNRHNTYKGTCGC